MPEEEIAAPSAAESRWFMAARWVLRGSFGVMLVSIGCFFYFIHTSGRFPEITVYVLFTSLGLGVLSGAVLIGKSFVNSQARFLEWLVTFWVATAISGLIKALAAPQRAAMIGFTFVAFLLTLAGSNWAWSRIRRIGLEDTRKRLALLVCGWGAAVGSAGLLLFVIFSFLNLWMGPPSDPEFWPWYISFGASSLLIIPAIVVIRRTRALVHDESMEVPVEEPDED